MAPTCERYRHGAVERVERAIADEGGRPSRPYRAVDTLAMMERRGSITAMMRQAGEDFRARFNRAHLEPLHAASFEWRPYGLSEGPQLAVERARRAVWRMLVAVGGVASPGGSCLWHVVGLEQTLKDWALSQHVWRRGRIDPEVAAGILIATLGALEHYTLSNVRF